MVDARILKFSKITKLFYTYLISLKDYQKCRNYNLRTEKNIGDNWKLSCSNRLVGWQYWYFHFQLKSRKEWINDWWKEWFMNDHEWHLLTMNDQEWSSMLMKMIFLYHEWSSLINEWSLLINEWSSLLMNDKWMMNEQTCLKLLVTENGKWRGRQHGLANIADRYRS